MTLYKFTPWQWGIEYLNTGLIKFSRPTELNDIHDCFPGVSEEDLRQKIKEANPDSDEESLEKIFNFLSEEFEKRETNELYQYISKNCAVFSLSASMKSPLLWGHYADAHKGMVIGFDSEHPFFNSSKGEFFFGVVKKVTYCRIRPTIPTSGPIPMDFLFKKSPSWLYEQEHRLILAQEDATNPGMEHLKYAVPHEAVVSVTFGALMPMVRNREAVVAINNLRGQDVEIQKASWASNRFSMKTRSFS